MKGFASISRPLNEMMQANAVFNWTPGCEEAFQFLKQALVSPPVLAFPREDGQIILDTDASNYGLAAVQSQIQDDVERPFCFFSKSMTQPERNYCVTRKELLAVVAVVKQFHHYLFGRQSWLGWTMDPYVG